MLTLVGELIGFTLKLAAAVLATLSRPAIKALCIVGVVATLLKTPLRLTKTSYLSFLRSPFLGAGLKNPLMGVSGGGVGLEKILLPGGAGLLGGLGLGLDGGLGLVGGLGLNGGLGLVGELGINGLGLPPPAELEPLIGGLGLDTKLAS